MPKVGFGEEKGQRRQWLLLASFLSHTAVVPVQLPTSGVVAQLPINGHCAFQPDRITNTRVDWRSRQEHSLGGILSTRHSGLKPFNMRIVPNDPFGGLNICDSCHCIYCYVHFNGWQPKQGQQQLSQDICQGIVLKLHKVKTLRLTTHLPSQIHFLFLCQLSSEPTRSSIIWTQNQPKEENIRR